MGHTSDVDTSTITPLLNGDHSDARTVRRSRRAITAPTTGPHPVTSEGGLRSRTIATPLAKGGSDDEQALPKKPAGSAPTLGLRATFGHRRRTRATAPGLDIEGRVERRRGYGRGRASSEQCGRVRQRGPWPTDGRKSERADRRHGRDTRWRWLLAGGLGRRRLRFRRRPVRWQRGKHHAESAHRRYGVDPRGRLLAGGGRRRHLLLRRCPVSRQHRRSEAEPAHRRHGGDLRRRGLLAGGGRTAASSRSATPCFTAPPAGDN